MFEMYKVIPENEHKSYTHDEIYSQFDGKWVYLTNSVYTKSQELVHGVIVVIADNPFEGVEDGIYTEFNRDEYGTLAEIDQTDSIPDITSIFWSKDI